MKSDACCTKKGPYWRLSDKQYHKSQNPFNSGMTFPVVTGSWLTDVAHNVLEAG